MLLKRKTHHNCIAFRGVFYLFNKKIFRRLKEFRKHFKRQVTDIHHELNDHLISINDNTSEIVVNSEKIREIDAKLEGFEERIDKMETLVESFLFNPEKFKNINLNLREQEIFLILYGSTKPLKYKDIIKKTGLAYETVTRYVEYLIIKGIPVHKTIESEDIAVTLDEDFKAFQMKNNLISLDKKVISQLDFESIENYY